jgi:hypothetical protein
VHFKIGCIFQGPENFSSKKVKDSWFLFSFLLKKKSNRANFKIEPIFQVLFLAPTENELMKKFDKFFYK